MCKWEAQGGWLAHGSHLLPCRWNLPSGCYGSAGGEARKAALEEFYNKWKGEPLVILKWVTVQVRSLLRTCARGLSKQPCLGPAARAAWNARKTGCALPTAPQAMSNAPGNVAALRALVEHPAFTISNPNNCYSLFLAFAHSPINFHAGERGREL